MPSIRLSGLAKDYIDYRKDRGENTSLDSALREVLQEADPDWRMKAREYRDESHD